MDLREALRIFEIDEKATPAEIKQRYKDLVSIWHPDRHRDNPRRCSMAQEKLKQINAAYECIRSHFADRGSSESRGESQGQENSTVLCPSCGKLNRYPHGADRESLKCGKCHSSLFKAEKTQKDSESFEDLDLLCPDGTCIGVIDSNGICSECGRTVSEAREG